MDSFSSKSHAVRTAGHDNENNEDDGSLIWLNGSGPKQAILRFSCMNLDQPGAFLTGKHYGMLFRLQTTESRLLRRIMDAHGVQESPLSIADFNLLWTGSHPKPYVWGDMHDYQRVNHFPRSYELTRKDRLCKNIERMKYVRGAKHFDFIPLSFVLPNEYQEFCSAYLKDRGAWIVKPVASSRGRGIYLISHPDQVPAEETVVVCKYIENPLLVDGFKCDVRLYVVVTSFDPLLVYLYEEGLARFAALKYENSQESMCNPCIHLTNYSVNKFHTDFIQNGDAEVDDFGNKWSLSALLRHLKLAGENTTKLMQDIEAIIIKSLVAVTPTVATACTMFVPHRRNCFELFGYDILIDSTLRPWLLEVNLSPSLACDAPLDCKIKSALLCDMLTMVGLPAVNPTRSRRSKQRRRPGLRSRAPSVDSVLAAGGGRGGSVRSLLTSEEARILTETRMEYARRGSFIRVFPTPETWHVYGCFLESVGSTFNLMLHDNMFPASSRPQGKSAGYGHAAGVFKGARAPRSYSVTSANRRRAERTACYERPLNKGCRTAVVPDEPEDPQQAEQLRVGCLHDVLNQLQSGVGMRHATDPILPSIRTESGRRMLLYSGMRLFNSLPIDVRQLPIAGFEQPCVDGRYQARVAFSFYLQQIQRRFMASLENIPDPTQLDLVMQFVLKAARNLSDPRLLQRPPRHVTTVEKVILYAKQLGDFIHLYSKDTAEHVTAEEGDAFIDPQLHKRFVTGASESDLEQVLTVHTSLYQSAELYLGRANSTGSCGSYRPPAGRAESAQQLVGGSVDGGGGGGAPALGALLKSSLQVLPSATAFRRQASRSTSAAARGRRPGLR